MTDDDDPKKRPMPIYGERSKPWILWRVSPIDGRQIERVAEADTREGLKGYRRRQDWRYKIYHNLKPVD
jgi:hypothetical protein